jgi:magnesium transporter
VITDLIEAYISLNGHRLNQIMKVLTVVTVIFVPLTLLVGIYGMNFENMPELKSENGYYILLSSMTGIVALLLYLFRRTRWL